MNKEIFYNYCPIIQIVDYFSNKWKAAVSFFLTAADRERYPCHISVISIKSPMA